MTCSDSHDRDPRIVCRAWLGDGAVDVQRLPSDGFSGAPLAVVIPADGAPAIVLKPFPAAARPRLEWVHALVRHLRSAVGDVIPEVLVSRAGGTIHEAEGRVVWEAVRYVAGTAVDPPMPDQAAAALEAVARVHRAARAWPAVPPTVGSAAAVIRRRDQAARLLQAPWREPAFVRPGDALAEGMAWRLASAIAIARAADLTAALRGVADFRPPSLERQAVLRDVWSGHVLFVADRPVRVAGIVDLHAAGVDTPATDIARLIGSWQRDVNARPEEAWADAVAAYERIRPLACDERRLVGWLDASATIFGLDNWFRWVLAEGREFADTGRVLGRVDRLLACLPAAIARLARQEPAV